MAPYINPKISSADGLALGAVQIMIGLFHVLMWYLLLVLYMGQTKGVFGAYEPITYKAACSLWGTFFILSGISIIKVARDPNQRAITYALILSVICMIASVVALCLTVLELSHFRSLSYRNYGQAKVGREVSRILLLSYPLEFSIAFVYLILICSKTKIFILSFLCCIFVKMEEDSVWIREETRMLGAIQVMVGVLHHCLALLWTYLLITQIIAFQNDYLPLALLTGFPYWSAIFFITSGICAIILERKRGKSLVTYTVVMSIISACIASLGTLIILFEFLLYYIKRERTVWPQRCGKILTEYLFLFTLLELTVASIVAHWGLKAKRNRG